MPHLPVRPASGGPMHCSIHGSPNHSTRLEAKVGSSQSVPADPVLPPEDRVYARGPSIRHTSKKKTRRNTAVLHSVFRYEFQTFIGACCSTYLCNLCCRVSNVTRLIRCPQRTITCSSESKNTWGWYRSSNMFGQERIATSLHAAIQS